MGWLGWGPDVALSADVNCILIAMEGKIEMMNPAAIGKEKRGSLAASKFRSFARDHNLRWGVQHG
jgi:hypothetical protein